MAETSELHRRAGEFLRHLATACATYRLFPGQPDQPAFRAAMERLDHATEALVGAGPFHLRLESARWSTDEGELPSDEVIDRFGTLCFERRIEHLHVHTTPPVDELVSFAEFLMLSPAEVVEQRGARAVLELSGVAALTVGEITVDEDAEDPELADLDPTQRRIWDQLSDPGGLAASFMVAGLPKDPASAAQHIYEAFRGIDEVLPDHVTARRDFLADLHEIFPHLPPAIAAQFHATVFTRLTSDAFAMKLAVNLTDQQLVDALFDLSAQGGPDPYDLGQRILGVTDRKPAVLDLIRSRRDASAVPVAQLADGGANLVALALAEGTDAARSAAADALADQLVDAASIDATAVRELFPDSAADHRVLVLMSLQDYLVAEDRGEVFDAVLVAWVEGVRAAIVARQEPLVERLMAILARAVDGDRGKASAADRARASIPAPELVRALLATRPQDTPSDVLAAPLRVFGAAGLGAVLDVLAEEQSAPVRARLLGIAAELTPGNIDVVAERIDDDRWYVVRNLATILSRSGVGVEAMRVLARLAVHDDAVVRREVVRALVVCAGPDAVAYLQRLASDDSEAVAADARRALANSASDGAARALADLVRRARNIEHRHEALKALAGHPAPVAGELLDELAGRASDLPRPLRREAKQLARSRPRGVNA